MQENAENSTLKSLLSDDKKSNKVQDLGVQIEGNFEKNAIFGAMSLKIISFFSYRFQAKLQADKVHR